MDEGNKRKQPQELSPSARKRPRRQSKPPRKQQREYTLHGTHPPSSTSPGCGQSLLSTSPSCSSDHPTAGDRSLSAIGRLPRLLPDLSARGNRGSRRHLVRDGRLRGAHGLPTSGLAARPYRSSFGRGPCKFPLFTFSSVEDLARSLGQCLIRIPSRICVQIFGSLEGFVVSRAEFDGRAGW
jgi:hypothetical protein